MDGGYGNINPTGVYGRLPGHKTLVMPCLADSRWRWAEEEVVQQCPASTLLTPPPPTTNPPAGRTFPQAQSYQLKRDSRFLRGYRYATPFRPHEKEFLRDKLLHVNAPPEVNPQWIEGEIRWAPLPAMIQMIPGVPFTHDMPDSDMVLTIGCLHTPESIQQYGEEGAKVLAHLEDLRKITFGSKASPENGQLEVKPIYAIPFLKRNERSGTSSLGDYDGSYSLASTVGEGNGAGCFMPAMQNDTASARQVIGSALHHLHAIWRILFSRSVSKMEHDLIEFDGLDNNTFSFGGFAPGPTSLQMNVTSHGCGFKEAIGAQASWHTDFKDAPTHYTMAVIFLNIPEG